MNDEQLQAMIDILNYLDRLREHDSMGVLNTEESHANNQFPESKHGADTKTDKQSDT